MNKQFLSYRFASLRSRLPAALRSCLLASLPSPLLASLRSRLLTSLPSPLSAVDVASPVSFNRGRGRRASRSRLQCGVRPGSWAIRVMRGRR